MSFKLYPFHGRAILTAIFFCLMSYSGSVLAIGDSTGGCSDSSELLKAVFDDDVAAFDTETKRIVKRISDYEYRHALKTERATWYQRLIGQKWRNGFPPNFENYQKIAKDRIINFSLCNYGQSTKLLDLAVASGSLSIVKYLIDEGADVNGISLIESRTQTGTVFSRCYRFDKSTKLKSENQKQKLLAYQYLISRGGNPNLPDATGRTAAHLCDDIEVLSFLLKSGLDVSGAVGNSAFLRRAISTLGSVNTGDYGGGKWSWFSDITPELDFDLLRLLGQYVKEPTFLWKNTSGDFRTNICSACAEYPMCQGCAQMLPKQKECTYLAQKMSPLIDKRAFQKVDPLVYPWGGEEQRQRCIALLYPEDWKIYPYRKYVDHNGFPLKLKK